MDSEHKEIDKQYENVIRHLTPDQVREVESGVNCDSCVMQRAQALFLQLKSFEMKEAEERESLGVVLAGSDSIMHHPV